MSFAQILSSYLTLNVLIALAFVALNIVSLIASRIHKTPSASAELRLHYSLLAIIAGLACMHPALPKQDLFDPPAKIWSAQSIRSFPAEYTSPDKGGYLGIPIGPPGSSIEADTAVLALLAIFTLVSLVGLYRIISDLRTLARIRKNSFLTRRIGRVQVWASENITVPFSYWLPHGAHVVLPSSLLHSPVDYKIALSHELQHHRQGDTRWIYGIWALRVLCAANPAVHLWNRWLSEIQEFACDETLVDQGKVESQAYARCLVEVAQTAFDRERAPACATGLTFLTERNLLRRRIEKMISKTQPRANRMITIGIGLTITAIMTATAFASQGLVQDRRIGLAQAQTMAERIQKDSNFPIVVNDLVLTQLNRYIGTPEGREYMRKALQRMESYRPMIETKLVQYGMPNELMAIPLIESGYQNLEDTNHKGWGAGIWMFIQSTARNYGLRVDAETDERLNAERLTDAAMRLLKADQLMFNDWQLAILAYNTGEKIVQQGIRSSGSRDAWTLIRQGHENDKDYLAKVMAAVLIMKNPDSVK